MRDLIQHGTVENLPLSEADLVQRFLQIVRLDVVVAAEREVFYGGPFQHGDDQRISVAPQLDVPEKAGRVQGADRFGDALLRHHVADVDGQIVVDRAFGDALGALHFEVAHDEGLHPLLGPGGDGRKQPGEQQEAAKSLGKAHQPNIRAISL